MLVLRNARPSELTAHDGRGSIHGQPVRPPLSNSSATRPTPHPSARAASVGSPLGRDLPRSIESCLARVSLLNRQIFVFRLTSTADTVDERCTHVRSRPNACRHIQSSNAACSSDLGHPANLRCRCCCQRAAVSRWSIDAARRCSVPPSCPSWTARDINDA